MIKTTEVTKETDAYAQFEVGSIGNTIIAWYCGNALLVRQSKTGFRAFGPVNNLELNPLKNTELTVVFYYL